MSLYSAMLAGVAGLRSNTSALAAISDNIANVNTVGYKDNAVDFETLVTNASAGAYTAGGVATVNQQAVTQQGATTQTASPTDLAIAGQGMFVTASNPSAISTTNPVAYTRAGSFTTDSSGNLVNTGGLYLLGWPADSTGAISPTGSLSSLQPINVDALAGAVSATSTAGLTGNLNSSQAVSTAATLTPPATGAYDPTTNSMTAYDGAGNGVKPDFTMQVPVSDSQGGQHTLQVDFLKSPTANTWNVEIQSVPASDVPGGAVPGQIATGTVTFNSDGSLNSASSALTSLSIPWNASLGVTSPQTVSLSLAGANGSGGLSQLASASALQNVTSNGTSFGSVSSVSVDKYGVVSANFSNGSTRPIAQIALATFANEDGLNAVNGNAYQATASSGAANLQTAGAGGAGAIASSALEASTVDLSTEFTNLITAQSAYSASSKVITTANQMTQTLLAIIQG